MPRSTDYATLRAIQGNPIVDTRKGDRHKGPRKNHKGGKTKTKWERKSVVAWDGEGANIDGEHIYNLLANSKGDMLTNPDGLTTQEVLDFFIDHGHKYDINVIYGGSYDVNMFLRDLPDDKVQTLWDEGNVMWGYYRIYYAPRKKFTVQRYYYEANPTGGKPKLTYDSFTLWDVLGYFQTSFVVACRKWLGDLAVLDEIETMKFHRSEFKPEELPEIIEYNHKECMLLVQLMGALFTALDNAGIKLVRYDGAGSIASSQLRANKVLQHKGEPNERVLRWAQRAYSGGRIEAPKIGNVDKQNIYRYDINSAYPAGCVGLPSYRGATWTFDSEWDGQDCSMVKVRWWPRGYADKWRQPFYPLWYREQDGTILYPEMGYGIYWGVELRNLIEHSRGLEWEIEEACNVHLANSSKPFAYINDMYHARLVLKKRGDMAAEAFKLGMNSTYGKLAQQVGARDGRIPTYHQLLWAGQITAVCRAQLYRAAMREPDSVIAFATDALLTTSKLQLPISDKLGDWTYDKFNGITIVQPGVYWLKDGAVWLDKYRGFDKGSLIRQHIVGCWLMGQDYEASLTRFMGLGASLATTDFRSHWRTWETAPRVLSLEPSGKRRPNKEDVCYWSNLCDTIAAPNLNDQDLMSKPYPLLWDQVPQQDRELKQFENDLQDSYA